MPPSKPLRTPGLSTALVALVALLALVAGAACGAGGGGTRPAARLTLVAYSTPQEAYDKITDAFRKTAEGRNITFARSYGASGEQSRAVENGLDADVVAFSLEPDMTRLVRMGLVAESWNADPQTGMITNSVVVLVVRKGNPKNIRTWADLTRPGVDVVTPNPFTSGGARWNVMAAFGQAARSGGGEQAGVGFLRALFKNVSVQDDSARKSLQTFTSGQGDVLIAYENEAIFARQKGQPVDYVVPDSTILIENPVAVTATSKNPEQAAAFLRFLRGPEAQRIFAGNGYRPVTGGPITGGPITGGPVTGGPITGGPVASSAFPAPSGLFTVADFGGWADVTKRFFDPAGSIMADIQRSNGISVG